MTIEKLNEPPNFASFLDLLKLQWPEEYSSVGDDEKIRIFAESYDAATDTIFTLNEKSLLAGYGRYSLWPRDRPDYGKAHLLDIAVQPDYQQRGWGRSLLQKMLDDCRGKKIRTMLSRSFKSNRSSRAFHRAAGFRILEETDEDIKWILNL